MLFILILNNFGFTQIIFHTVDFGTFLQLITVKKARQITIISKKLFPLFEIMVGRSRFVPLN